ncbi:nicotinate-nucleotide--dimethylbenzimidazole phosphoribosyltransferase [Kitasatospora albolonga]|uniref:nicotinate-nucleotide--dimethylbenzimidazole phosphoribosyltransferase n=1 Tax=Kitasatospora albolonga TaxID=68173 RepID=UPI0035E63973
MTDGGHVPSEGLPEHLLGGADPLGRPEGVPLPGQAPARHAAYTFLDDEEEDLLLMPGPQASWGDVPVHGAVETVMVGETAIPAAAPAAPSAPGLGSPLVDTVTLRPVDELGGTPAHGVPLHGTPAHGTPLQDPLLHGTPAHGTPVQDAVAQDGVAQGTPAHGTPVEPSWPPLAPPVPGVDPAVAPLADPLTDPLAVAPFPGAPAAGNGAGQFTPPGVVPDALANTVQATAPVAAAEPVVQTVPVTPPQPQRRPLHAGPPIPDPSLMTGHVPVRSLADRGPSGGTPAYGVPIVPAPPLAAPVPTAAVPVQAVPVPAQLQPEAGAPVQPEDVQAVGAPIAVEPVVVAEAAPAEVVAVAVEQVAVEAVETTVESVAVESVAVESVAVESVAVEPVAVVEAGPAAAEAPVVETVVNEAPVTVPAEAVQTAGTAVEEQQPPQAPAEALAEVPVEPAQPVAVEQPAEHPSAEPVAEAAPAQAGPISLEPVFVEPVAVPQPEAVPAAQPEAAPEAEALAATAEQTEQTERTVSESTAPELPLAEAVPAEPGAAPAVEDLAVAAAVAVAVEPTAEQPETVAIPAQAAAPARQPGRISAFLAAPAPDGLPAVEAEPQPGRATVPGDAAAEVPAAEQPAETGPAAQPGQAAVATPAEESAPEAEPSAEAVATEPVATEAAEVPTDAAVAETEEQAGTGAVAEEERPPAAAGFDEAAREAVHQVIRERRDIRNGFRPDPIPHEVLIRVLEAAHTAPSVGYSQPWDFVVIRSAKTRRKMHELAERQREAYADSLPKARAKQFKEIKIEAILETPVNIVVTADRTRGGRHTLGRHTQPQMAPYSAALAVENLWLAARAEGLGVGWVSFFDEEEMVRELGLPDHLDVVAYLCVGYVDSFPDEPELQQQGWAKKRPLSWVVHEEQYGNRALPGEEPSDLLAETLRGIRPLDAKALGDAWDRQKRMTKPAGSLGVLEIIGAQLSGLSRKCPPPIPEPGCVAVFAGDHGVHAQGVTPWPQEVTAQMVANFLAGGAVVNAFAAQVGAEVCVVDVGVASELPGPVQNGRTTGLLPRKVKPGTDDMTQGPAMSREEALKAIEVGIETARDLVSAGNKVLVTGDMGIANTTASAALISVFAGLDPAEVTGRGTGIDDETHARKIEVIRTALALHQPDPADPIGVLAAVGGLEHAAIAGFLLGAASLRTPVILDGVIAGSAALVAKAIAPEVLAACIAGHRSAEPGHKAALEKLGLRPLIELDLRLGEGTGALLALPLVQSAARAMHDVATFDSAGVTEKN